MTDTFSFKAARPKATKAEAVNQAAHEEIRPVALGLMEPPIKRKRRTRAEMAEVKIGSGEELMALKNCIKQLRGLSDQSRLTVMTTLKAVFE